MGHSILYSYLFFIPPPPNEDFLKFHTLRNFTSRCPPLTFESFVLLGHQSPQNITFSTEPLGFVLCRFLRPFRFSLPLSHKRKQPLGFFLKMAIWEPLRFIPPWGFMNKKWNDPDPYSTLHAQHHDDIWEEVVWIHDAKAWQCQNNFFIHQYNALKTLG